MKNIIRLFAPALMVFMLVSCNDRLGGDELLGAEPVKIDSVQIANDTMDIFSTQTIKTFSDYRANCEGFYGYDYVHKAALAREVTSYRFKTSASCGDVVSRASQINFRPQETGVYTFRFWTGSESGANTWLEKTIVVK